ncbi:MAG: dephospho-CoA kinase [Mangrovibacterium sp.]
MLKIGITGGIGSGKSTICKFFSILGVPVFMADVEAKMLMNRSPLIRERLTTLFGQEIYGKDSFPDRRKLAEIIFHSPDLLKKVNEIIHPEVRNYFMQWVQNQSAAYVVYEAAILFETGYYRMMDFTILVTAPEEERIRRVLAREETTEEDVKSRIQQQWPDQEKAKLADYVIQNNNEELILPQLIELDKKFRSDG